MPEIRDLATLLKAAQEYITSHFSIIFTSDADPEILKNRISKFVRDSGAQIPNMTNEQITLRLYEEMAQFGKLTHYLDRPDLEEININGWDDVALTFSDGHIEKQENFFFSPGHAEDIIKRLLRHSGMIIDNSKPITQGHLPGNTRITALKTPLVDPDRGIAASIRLLRPRSISRDTLVSSGFAAKEMLDMLCLFARYGVPFVIAGATSSGKTTLLNAVLDTIPDEKRIFTIESGSRELSLIRKENGKTTNNVVHTLSRPSDNPAYDISQEDLVVASLRFDPDIVCVGEMRDTECYSAVEASLTGHTVLSTVHAGPGSSTHTRIALLCQKKYPIDFSTCLTQVAQAFPVVVWTHKPENGCRKIMDITECVVSADGKREYRTLYTFQTDKSGKGKFVKESGISEELVKRMERYGLSPDKLKALTKGEAS